MNYKRLSLLFLQVLLPVGSTIWSEEVSTVKLTIYFCFSQTVFTVILLLRRLVQALDFLPTLTLDMACIPLSYRCCTFWQNLFPLPIISQKVHKCCIAISMMEVFESCPYRLWSPDKSSSKSCSCEPKEFSSNQSLSNRPATMVANLITYAFNFDFNSSQMFGAMECLIVFFLRLFHSFSRVSSQTTSAIEWLVLNKSMAFKLFKKTNGHKNKLTGSVDARIS